ncbi:MAG: 1-(5-phosphoribosyl)-5-[(5-phosphoribosylamino)methylideneamino]imidazole-4-carboxamide isomerase [Planctomycetaceae bacterium]|jgi:phosphoribosylformimino-5-aminoimidazole carboxamide ribotide isomerase|nr:1-(5-phosphoribosyl)-5-[(5-phosphoribosylamino)methylideneamino]imidazole-4-carboxamide isomerase [Planctomycetaceae bacterium]
MIILPAIDIRNGKCVRLQQGDYGLETVYADSPEETAKQWEEQGAEFLHLVDLDGAKEKKPVNAEAVCRIARSVKIPVEVGGGIRHQETIQHYLDAGVNRIVIGTLALKEPEWFCEMCRLFPNKLVLGIDGRDGFAATEGWLENSRIPAAELAKRYIGLPIAALVYTDIAKDGMLAGPNFAEMKAMRQAVPFPVIASGGIASLDDIRQLAGLGFPACITGKALYEGKFTLAEAIRAARAGRIDN